MPDEEIELPQDHGEDKKEALNDYPDWVEHHHSVVYVKVCFGIADEDVFDQYPEGEDPQGQLPAEQQHQPRTPIHAGHGQQNEKELRVELDLVLHI